MSHMLRFRFLFVTLGALCCTAVLTAEPPPLLAKAITQLNAGLDDVALTQRTKVFADDGSVAEERLERYDPSLPDNQRWRLLEVDRRPATVDERQKWETKKNSRPRKKAIKPPIEYLDLDHAVLARETAHLAVFEVNFRPEAARLIAVDKLSVLISIEKESAAVSHIAATLREPLRVALGIVKITDIDLDVGFTPGDESSMPPAGEVRNGSTGRVVLSKFGSPMEFRWSDFKRVQSFRRAQESATRQPTPTPKK